MRLSGEIARNLTLNSVLRMSESEVEDTFHAIRWPESGGSPTCDRCGSGKYYAYSRGGEYRCSDCYRSFTVTSGTIFRFRKMCLRSYLLAIAFFGNTNGTALQYAKETGTEYRTAWALARKIRDHVTPPTSPVETQPGRKRKIIYLDCPACGKHFLDVKGSKSSDLRRGKIKNAFCSHHCAMNYGCRQRKNDTCKRCFKTRTELAKFRTPGFEASGVSFTRGYCPTCWRLLYTYHQDEELVKSHELTQQLRKEAIHDKRKKHGRSAEDAAGGNRGRQKGKGRSSASPGDQCSFFPDSTIGPTRL